MSGDSAPVLKLTKEEALAIEKMWAIARSDLKGTGVQFFLHLFTMFPQHKSKFRSFATVPHEELADNKRFQAHAVTIMNALSALVDSLGDTEVLTEMLLKTGENHGRRKLVPSDFQHVQDSLLDFFPKALGDAYTPTANEGWIKVLNVWVKTLQMGIERYYAENPAEKP